MIKPDKLNLKQWAIEDRPREKMKQKGASALTNAELLAILIHTGNTEDSVVALTQKVMASCRNSLSELGKLSVGELCSFKGHDIVTTTDIGDMAEIEFVHLCLNHIDIFGTCLRINVSTIHETVNEYII